MFMIQCSIACMLHVAMDTTHALTTSHTTHACVLLLQWGVTRGGGGGWNEYNPVR